VDDMRCSFILGEVVDRALISRSREAESERTKGFKYDAGLRTLPGGNLFQVHPLLSLDVQGRSMAKKRISGRDMRGIARRRMERLLDLALVEAKEGRTERSRRYVQLARSIGMRTNTPMLKKRLYCHECMVALVPGYNCRVRLRSNRIGVHCLVCGHVRRMPYLKERTGVKHADEKE
jgi:ribonuclease P protein subunit RPR2